MANLIQLTQFSNAEPIILNAEQITYVHSGCDDRDGAGVYTRIGLTSGGMIKVCEGIYEVAKRIGAQA